jgi:carboxypeptidase PM20D1
LLKENFQPERTIYLAFGHDEEIGGENGAVKIAAYLQAQNVKADFVLDEGLVITQNIVPGLVKPVALIGIAEKGYLSLELTVNADGGHSSMPTKETAIGILSAAVSKIENTPMPAKFSEPVNHFLEYVGPEMPFFQKMAFANQWLFKNTIISKYEKSNSGNATVRTTTAPTMFNSGIKDNVLPGTATAVINFRLLPGETQEDVIAHVKGAINDDRIQIKKYGHYGEASPVSDVQSESFSNIQKSIGQVFENTISTPALVIAATDARHYSAVADNAYRFLPLICKQEDLKRIHGLNEKISIENFKDCIRFYRQLIINTKP